METKFYPPTIKDGKIVAFADVDIVEGITVNGRERVPCREWG